MLPSFKEILAYGHQLSEKKAVKQTGLLFSAQIAIIFIGYFIKAIQTRTLGAEDYGLYAFFGTLTSLLVIFFNFGIYPSIQVLIAEQKEKLAERRLIGIGIILSGLLGLAFSFLLIILSFFIDSWFNIVFGDALRIVAVLCSILPFRYLFQAVSTGTGNVSWFAYFDLFSKVFFFLFLLLFWWFFEISLVNVMIINMVGFFIALTLLWKTLNPSFSALKPVWSQLINKVKTYGLNYYWGFVANLSTFKADALFISYFVNTTQLGFYTLASILCSPMIMLSQAVASAMFKSFSSRAMIPSKLLWANFLWLSFCIAFLYLAGDFIVTIIFGADFSEVAKYLVPVSIAFFFQGMYQPYNFLAAKSQGKAIRNVSLAEALINISGNILLIAILDYGVMGAIYTSIFAKMFHYFGMLYYYRLYQRGVKE
ncbi:MAG: hypothetical protein EA412_05650 [Chitinophagaceae bacterium]|nr:MAG: hypothetical protein EA412_05650 [Chitinophagaceae bacterium]